MTDWRWGPSGRPGGRRWPRSGRRRAHGARTARRSGRARACSRPARHPDLPPASMRSWAEPSTCPAGWNESWTSPIVCRSPYRQHLDEGSGQPVTDDSKPGGRAEVGPAPLAGVVGMGVGQHRAGHRRPGVHVKAAPGAVEPLGGHGEEVVHRGGPGPGFYPGEKPRRARASANGAARTRRPRARARAAPRAGRRGAARSRSDPRSTPEVRTVASTTSARPAARTRRPPAPRDEPAHRGKREHEVRTPGQRRAQRDREAGHPEGGAGVLAPHEHQRAEEEHRRELGERQARWRRACPEPAGNVEHEGGDPCGFGPVTHARVLLARPGSRQAATSRSERPAPTRSANSAQARTTTPAATASALQRRRPRKNRPASTAGGLVSTGARAPRHRRHARRPRPRRAPGARGAEEVHLPVEEDGADRPRERECGPTPVGVVGAPSTRGNRRRQRRSISTEPAFQSTAPAVRGRSASGARSTATGGAYLKGIGPSSARYSEVPASHRAPAVRNTVKSMQRRGLSAARRPERGREGRPPSGGDCARAIRAHSVPRRVRGDAGVDERREILLPAC